MQRDMLFAESGQRLAQVDRSGGRRQPQGVAHIAEARVSTMPFAVRLDKGAHLLRSTLVTGSTCASAGPFGDAAALWAGTWAPNASSVNASPFSAVENSSAGTISRSAGGSPSVVASSALFFSAGVATQDRIGRLEALARPLGFGLQRLARLLAATAARFLEGGSLGGGQRRAGGLIAHRSGPARRVGRCRRALALLACGQQPLGSHDQAKPLAGHNRQNKARRQGLCDPIATPRSRPMRQRPPPGPVPGLRRSLARTEAVRLRPGGSR